MVWITPHMLWVLDKRSFQMNKPNAMSLWSWSEPSSFSATDNIGTKPFQTSIDLLGELNLIIWKHPLTD